MQDQETTPPAPAQIPNDRPATSVQAAELIDQQIKRLQRTIRSLDLAEERIRRI